MVSGNELVFSIFVYNIIFGSGVLLLPKVFWEVGYILGSVLLLLLAILSWSTCAFIIESLSLANFKTKMNEEAKLTPSTTTDEHIIRQNNSNQTSFTNNVDEYEESHVDIESYFNIDTKFEVAEMAKLFFGKVMMVIFYSLMVLYLYGDLCIYLSVVGTTLSGLSCPGNSTKTSYIEGICDQIGVKNMFRILVSAFFLVMSPFVFMNLKKSVYIHITTMILRLIAVTTMIVYASIRIYHGANHDIEKFRIHGVPNFFGVALYSFMCQHSLPSMIQYVKNKGARFTYWILLSMTCAFLLYLLTIVTATLAFTGAELNSIYSMNFSNEGEGWFDDFLYYYLMLFPTIALSASYPIIGITLRENLISLTEIIIKKPFVGKLRTLLAPMIAIVPSFILVMLLPDAVSVFASYVGSYAGSFVQYFIPACMVIWARKAIVRDFPDLDLTRNKNSNILFRSAIVPSIIIGWTFVGIGIVTYYSIQK